MQEIVAADLSQRLGEAERSLAAFFQSLLDPWVLTQVAVILACLAAAYFVGAKIEAALEPRVREVHGRPGLLRFLALALRRTRWIVAALALGIAAVTLDALTLADRNAIVGAAFALVAAWVAISVMSRLIRNRALARLVAWTGWIFVALKIVGAFDAVAVSLDAIALTVGTVRVSFWFVLQAVVLIAVMLWLAVVIGSFAERQIARNPDLTPSLRVLIGKLVRIVLLVVAGGVALNLLGIDITALAFFGGALGLGLGFGLQKVVSNFVSGIIILLDRSIKPGDTIAIGETFGWVRSLQARFVSVITRDGREYLIPNEDFVTQRVENWSFTDTLVRIDVTFGVAYDSDPHEVRRLAVDAAKGIERVQERPQPVCHLTAFGESSLDFILRFWVADPQNGVTNVRGAVLLACWDAFKAAGIGIPFPHRQILVEKPVPVRLEPGDDRGAGSP
ncbi:MAG: mechanosensitive ion channel family protein [Propylenella sp.]